jgi:alpha-galactosidase
LTFSAQNKGDDPVLSYVWDFGDGVTLEGSKVTHAYTEPGKYNVRLTTTSLSGASSEDHFQMSITGHMQTTFDPPNIKRYQPAN